ncbi:hypothetical protein [Bacterioplanoides sp.]|uniref:hypothetical protein n=1 Tax=Bacterioplanoides sp. TaxID=2066072 RepID=UPI003B006449
MAISKELAQDLSPSAIKKAVVSEAIQSPLTVYPIAISVISGVYSLAIYPGAVALGLLGVGAVAGIGSWAWQSIVKADDLANDFVNTYRAELVERRDQALSNLGKDLAEIGLDEGLGQIQLFKDKYDNFANVLDKQLEQGELTYNRYLSIAEQVFLGGLDNLDAASLAVHSVSAIDVKRIDGELAKTDNTVKVAELKSRKNMYIKQMDRVAELLLENEKALTQLDEVTTRIASVNTQQGRAQVALEDAMEELQHLITRAETYSR